MVLTNPWLVGSIPTARLPREQLEERILNLLSSQNMCVVATTGPDRAAATPVQYFHLGFTIVFSTSRGSPKSGISHTIHGRRSGSSHRWSALRAAGARRSSAVLASCRHVALINSRSAGSGPGTARSHARFLARTSLASA